MDRILMAIALLALLSAPATSQDKKDHGKTPELTKKFTDLMKSIGKDFKGIKDDVEKDKPEADIKKKLASIRETMVKAKALQYRKDEDEEEKLEGHFDIFDFKIKGDFEGVDWEGKEKRLYLLERLQSKCGVCHEIYRD
jgi:cytochrome c556